LEKNSNPTAKVYVGIATTFCQQRQLRPSRELHSETLAMPRKSPAELERWIQSKREAAADSAFLFGLIRTHDIEVDTNKGNTTPRRPKASE